MPYCLGCDPGLKNLAIAIIDSDTSEVVYLNKINLFKDDDGTEWELDVKLIPYMLEKFVKKNEHIFSKCSLFVCESQIQVKMHRVQFGLEALFSQYGRAVTVHPNSVKAWAKTRMGSYTENKREAIQWCNHNLSGVNLARFREYERNGLKQDDIADAIVMASYAVANRESLCKIILKEKGVDKPKKKRRRKKK